MQIRLHPMLRAIGLPLALGVCGCLVVPTTMISTVRADHPWFGHFGSGSGSESGSDSWIRLGRTLGIGWGDGYHTCRPRTEKRAADLPPATYYASPYVPAEDSAPSAFYDAQQARLPWLAHPDRVTRPMHPSP